MCNSFSEVCGQSSLPIALLFQASFEAFVDCLFFIDVKLAAFKEFGIQQIEGVRDKPRANDMSATQATVSLMYRLMSSLNWKPGKLNCSEIEYLSVPALLRIHPQYSNISVSW